MYIYIYNYLFNLYFLKKNQYSLNNIIWFALKKIIDTFPILMFKLQTLLRNLLKRIRLIYIAYFRIHLQEMVEECKCCILYNAKSVFSNIFQFVSLFAVHTHIWNTLNGRSVMYITIDLYGIIVDLILISWTDNYCITRNVVYHSYHIIVVWKWMQVFLPVSCLAYRLHKKKKRIHIH